MEFLNFIGLNKRDIHGIVKKINKDFFGSNEDLVKRRTEFLNKDIIKFSNETFVLKKFNKEDYKLFFNKRFISDYNKLLISLKNNIIQSNKKKVRTCVARYLLEGNQLEIKPAENFILINNGFNEIHESLYLDYFDAYKLMNLVRNAIKNIDIEWMLFDCIKKNIGHGEAKQKDLFFLLNFEQINKDFEKKITFKNYKNNKLILFLNIFIILSFISVYFFSKSIIKFLKTTQ